MKLRIDLTFLISWIVLFSVFNGNSTAYNVSLEEFKGEEKEVVQDIGGNGGGGGGYYVPPRVELKPREIQMTYLGIGSGQMFRALYLVGRDYDEDYAPVYIKKVEIDNPSIIDLDGFDNSVRMTGKEYGEATVTVDIYHRYYEDIWTTATIPVTVTKSVYIPK